MIAESRETARKEGFGSSFEAQGECQAVSPTQQPGNGLGK